MGFGVSDLLPSDAEDIGSQNTLGVMRPLKKKTAEVVILLPLCSL
jgi:hypothetical protein